MSFLTRVDSARNINRFYIVSITPTLFDEWVVVREWGRRGSPGTIRLDCYQHRGADADAAERRSVKRRLAHCYHTRLDAPNSRRSDREWHPPGGARDNTGGTRGGILKGPVISWWARRTSSSNSPGVA
jgi:predicted DNA-binding WGR domain protein